jgi:hypothetical protein
MLAGCAIWAKRDFTTGSAEHILAATVAAWEGVGFFVIA